MSDLKCTQPGCQVAVSGLCLEGFAPPSTCPHQTSFSALLKPDESTAPVEDAPVRFPVQESDFTDEVKLSSGEALTDVQAADVTASAPTSLVIIAGPYGSGKTTILTALFEAFQEAPFGNFLFRGSRTLIGFEKRCHPGRTESGQRVADTAHTSLREGVVFLHLDLASVERLGRQHKHVLLSDISGELFSKIRDSSDGVEKIQSLSRADHLCVVVDGAKLIEKRERHVAVNDSRSILRAILEANAIDDKCEIDLVITKSDLLVDAGRQNDGDETEQFVDRSLRAIESVCQGRRVNVFRVAARPPIESRTPFAHGLPTLLRHWVASPIESTLENSEPKIGAPVREVDRFTESMLARLGAEGATNVG